MQALTCDQAVLLRFFKKEKKMKKTIFAACIRQFSRVDTIGFVFNKMADQLI